MRVQVSPAAHIKSKPKIIAIVGPTASGKTSLSVALAKHFSGEIISADSRQVYCGLDIGTAKITQEEMRGIPHHLIDIVDVETTYTAHKFINDAEAAITKIITAGNLPIIAGGTFFYLDLLRGEQQVAAVPPNETLRAELETKTTDELVTLLATYDKSYLETIELKNPRRLIRALEILEALGTIPASVKTESPYDWLIVGLKVDKEDLRVRYENRATKWLKIGFLAEIETLLKQGVTKERLKEIGFEYSLGLELMAGEISEEEFITKFIQKNWQYAKRQYTWLKRNNEIKWFASTDIASIQAEVTNFLKD